MKTSICKSLTATCGLSLLLAGATAAPARAVLITEYMNGYGPVTVSDVDTLNGGTGWASGWVRDSTAANSARYIANTGLSYGGTGYSNFGNETGLNDGYFQRSSNEPVYSRDFAAPVTTSTIWVSGLLLFNRTDGRAAPQITLDGDSGTTSFGFFDLNDASGNENGALLALTGATTQMTTTNFALNTAHLILARIEFDQSGADDRVTFWVDPDVSGVAGGGAAALSAFTFQATGTLGTQLDSAGFKFGQTTGTLDALRVGTAGGDAGLNEVLTGVAVPAPGTVTLLVFGGLASTLVLRRRRLS